MGEIKELIDSMIDEQNDRDIFVAEIKWACKQGYVFIYRGYNILVNVKYKDLVTLVGSYGNSKSFYSHNSDLLNEKMYRKLGIPITPPGKINTDVFISTLGVEHKISLDELIAHGAVEEIESDLQ